MGRPFTLEPPQKGLHYALIFSSVYFLIKNSIEFGVVNLIESNENHSIDIYFEMLLSIGPSNIP